MERLKPTPKDIVDSPLKDNGIKGMDDYKTSQRQLQSDEHTQDYLREEELKLRTWESSTEDTSLDSTITPSTNPQTQVTS